MLWIGSAAATSMVAATYAFLGAHMWLRSRCVLGPVPPEANETLRVLLHVSRQGDSLKLMRIVLFYGVLSAFIVALAARELLGLVVAVALLAVIVWMHIRTTTVPVALILGTSNHSSIKRQRVVKHRLSPLRVVSLLDIDVPWDPTLTKELVLDCFRTTNEDDWWLVITRLMDIVPIIAIDAAAETPGVLREGSHILGSDLARRCLFLTPPDGSAPILDRLLPMPGLRRQDLLIVHYGEAPRVITAMVSELGRRRTGKTTPPGID